MKTEYILTAAAKAELEDIERQIMMLYARKADIYAMSAVKYVTETPEEFEAADRMYKFMYGHKPIQTEGIVKMIFEEKEEEK